MEDHRTTHLKNIDIGTFALIIFLLRAFAQSILFTIHYYCFANNTDRDRWINGIDG